MKKFGSLLMSALLCASLLAGCSSSASVSQSTVPETISTAEGAIETGSEEVSLEEMTAAKTENSTEALEESSDDTVVRVGGLKGPTTMGLVKLMDDAKNGTAANNYEFTMVTAADELTGLIWATALMRPSKSTKDLELKSVKKKFKQHSFAAGCSREVITTGAERLGWTVEDLISKTILAMRSCEDQVNEAMSAL